MWAAAVPRVMCQMAGCQDGKFKVLLYPDVRITLKLGCVHQVEKTEVQSSTVKMEHAVIVCPRNSLQETRSLQDRLPEHPRTKWSGPVGRYIGSLRQLDALWRARQQRRSLAILVCPERSCACTCTAQVDPGVACEWT